MIKSNYINSINYFRAIAIIFIVSSHCYDTANVHYSDFLGSVFYNLNKGGTYFFMFISGYLFHHVYYSNFNFKKFIIKKFKNVYIPYLILSTPPILYFVFFDNKSLPQEYAFFTPTSNSMIDTYVVPLLKYYITGFRLIANWYIPFIMIIFFLSPVFIKIINMKIKMQVILFFIMLIISLLIHKPHSESMSAFIQSVVYYSPVYLLGIIYSQQKDFLNSKLKNRDFHLLVIVLILASIQAYTGKGGNYYKNAFEYGGIDLMLLQKLCFSLFFVIFLRRFENKNITFLSKIADWSFGIFFTHGLFILFVELIRRKLKFEFDPNNFFALIFVFILIFSLSILSIIITKKIAGKRSRYIIGC